MKRSAFPPSPFPGDLRGEPEHPLPPFLAFLLLSAAIGLSADPAALGACALGVLFLVLWPRPSLRPLQGLLAFAPLLLAIPFFHLLDWRGFQGSWRLPWVLQMNALGRGLLAAGRMGLWILLAARTLDHLHPAALMARLPSRSRWARRCLAPVLALSWLDLMIREAWLLERAWRARGGSWRWAALPALLVPLFRNLLARSETLAESLSLRRFPERWAASPAIRLSWREAPALAVCAAVLIWQLSWGRG